VKLAEEIEKNLYLLGATAVEDKLQDQVPETIKDLIRANIKVWMLTGDKLETAENIAKACNLIQPGFQVMQCADRTKATVQETLLHHRKAYDYFVRKNIKKALIIEGESLAVIFGDSILNTLFLSISKGCEAVICCRVTPKQKAQVVRLIKNNMNKITLSIGDGANDVNMIQEAHIGIGIYGNEGMRAVQSSDFAIPEFKGLWKLLFVHGHWNYIRIGEMILYFFYKNMVFTIPQFYFAFFCVFSGRAVYDDFYISLYNIIFTSVPLAARAITDQDAYYKRRVKVGNDVKIETRPYIKKYFPKLYYIGQQNKIFSIPLYLKSVGQGIVQAVVILLVCHYGLFNDIVDIDGRNGDFWYFSITFYTSVIFVSFP
jgi:magnesium-transporting ATPase (P-type)